ncbi:MAG: acyltransferase family protein [Ornithinimicrobium sp.]|uniref:acyltransferase family protein n=1 Tax=Ornithinimicrobium sp. TaxID=1977084 RepID=UPI0026DF4341|nr:acyltransferase family protein [Ornithinimicrobium sp.]MDO5739149.1 acyltransferase family protein [Ornithinimicrobium sp.]
MSPLSASTRGGRVDQQTPGPDTEAPLTRARLRALRAARHALQVPPIRRDFRTDIEGMRAIAVIAVMLWHAGVSVVPGGFAGVDVFFVVSGFLMTVLLLEEGRARGRIDVPKFYARRARRLLPASLTALLGSTVLTLAVLPRTRWADIGADILSSAAYVVNWRLASGAVDYLDVSRAPSPVQHYWSLAVEEQFYLLWPLLLLALLVLASGRAKVFLVGSWVLTLVLLIASLGISWWWTQVYAAQAYFVTPTRIYELMLGAVVGLGALRWSSIPRWLMFALGWLGLGMVVASMFVINADMAFPGTVALLPTVGAALVLIAGFRSNRFGPDLLLRARWMQWVGRISYSLYLWHWPFVAAAASLAGVGRGGPETLPVHWGLLAVVISIVPAWLSFRYVEDPIRVRGRLLSRALGPGVATRRTLLLGINCTLAGVLAGMVLLFSAPPSATTDAVAWRTPELVDQFRAPVGAGMLSPEDLAGAFDDQLLAGSDLGEGAQGMLPAPAPSPRPDPPIPDQLGTLAIPVEQVPDDRPVNEPEGCFIGLAQSKPGVCRAGDPDGDVTVALFGDSHAGMWITALDEIGRDRGWRVLSITKSSCPPTEELTFARDAGPAGYQQCQAYQPRAWEQLIDSKPDVVVLSSAAYRVSGGTMAEALARRVDGLRAAGIMPVLIRDVPRPDFDVPECLLAHPDKASACAFDRAEGLQRAGTGQGELESMRPGLPMIDLTEAICPGARCSPVLGDVVVWRDTNHLSATYIRSLTDLVDEALTPWVELSRLPAPAGSTLLEGRRIGEE